MRKKALERESRKKALERERERRKKALERETKRGSRIE